VTDVRSNANDQIVYAAKILAKSPRRRAIFEYVCAGKKAWKSVHEIAKAKRWTEKKVLTVAKQLVDRGLIGQGKTSDGTAYTKDVFFAAHKAQILRLAVNPGSIGKIPTKVRPVTSGGATTIRLTLPRSRVDAVRLSVDDFDSFAKVRRIKHVGQLAASLSERAYKDGIQDVLDEAGVFKDWGGEGNDLFTDVIVRGRRMKVPGTKGKLTPGMMGKNGDQILRLFRSPADAFVVQYHGQVDESTDELMQRLAQAKSALEGRRVYFSVFGGRDSSRLIRAYPNSFR
jgi:hypothetical protein